MLNQQKSLCHDFQCLYYVNSIYNPPPPPPPMTDAHAEVKSKITKINF